MERAHPDHSMISSNRVEGTVVYSPDGERIGTLDHVMIDKLTGQVRYAVIGFGGFLGIGGGHHPIPWSALEYDTGLGGYKTPVTEDQLKDAPEFSDDDYGNRAWEARVHDTYGVPYYWGAM